MIFELEIVTRTHVPISSRILVERKGENRCRKIDSFFSEAALGNLVKQCHDVWFLLWVYSVCLFIIILIIRNNVAIYCYNISTLAVSFSKIPNLKSFIIVFCFFFSKLIQPDYDINASILLNIAPSYKRVCEGMLLIRLT